MQLQLLQNIIAKNNVTSQDLLLNPQQKHLSYLTSIKKQVFIQTDYAGQLFKNENWPEFCRKLNFERPHYNPLSKMYLPGSEKPYIPLPSMFPRVSQQQRSLAFTRKLFSNCRKLTKSFDIETRERLEISVSLVK